jgi:hypothetical protein
MADTTLDFASLDAQVDPSTEVQQEQIVDQSQEVQQTDQSQQTQQEVQVDGRRGPQNVRNAIKAASEAMPEQAAHFKELGNAYFREQAYKQAFPTPQEAASAKQLIEGVGGVEGITTIQQRAASFDQQDLALKDGNPEVLDAFFKDFPEGAAALAPHYMEKLAAANPTAFSAAIAPHAISMLEQAGVGGHLDSILNETDPARAKALVQQLAEWFRGQKSNVAQLKTQPQKNPAADRITEQQKQLETEREQLFSERVSEKVTSSVNPEIQKTVDQYAKQYKLNDTQKMHFQNALQQKIVAEMNGDKTYKQQVDLRKANKGRTHDSVASYISSEFNRRLKDAAFATAKEIYGAPRGQATATTGVVKAGTPTTAPGGGPLKVSQRPPDNMLDLARPGADMDLIRGRGYTKDGRFISWR